VASQYRLVQRVALSVHFCRQYWESARKYACANEHRTRRLGTQNIDWKRGRDEGTLQHRLKRIEHLAYRVQLSRPSSNTPNRCPTHMPPYQLTRHTPARTLPIVQLAMQGCAKRLIVSLLSICELNRLQLACNVALPLCPVSSRTSCCNGRQKVTRTIVGVADMWIRACFTDLRHRRTIAETHLIRGTISNETCSLWRSH
jgi:hypothetical protein